MSFMPRSPFRTALVLPSLAAVGVLLWWRGPDWNVVYHAFDFVNWAWIAFAMGLNLGSVLLRSLAAADDRPGAPATPTTFQPRLLGLLDRAARERDPPGRIGELARVAVLRRHVPRSGTKRCARRHRLRPPPVRPVPRPAARRLRAADCQDPGWAVTSLVIVSAVGILLFTAALAMPPAASNSSPTTSGRCGGW